VVDPNNDHEGDLRLQPFQLGLSLCAPELSATLRLSLCVQTGLGMLAASAKGFAMGNDDATEPWVELGPEASARVALLAPMYVRFGVHMPIRLSRPAFAYTQTDTTPSEIFRVSAVGFGGELALGVDFF
jgi:hypothetical protein